MKKIVLYSNRHRADDNRIIELEALTFANAGYETIVYGKTDNIAPIYNNIQVHTCKNKENDCLEQCLIEDADLYIFHDPGLLSCAVKLHNKGKKVLFDSHENYEEKFKTRIVAKFPFLKPVRKQLSKVWWLYEKKCITSIDGAICADRTVKNKYGKNSFLLPNMPTKQFYEFLPSRTDLSDSFKLIYVGTLTWDRGIIETITAIKLCKHQNIEFHVIGDTQDEKLKDVIKNAEKTIWHGRIPWIQLKDYLVNADLGIVLLQPTEAYLYYPGENIVKLWEYMSIGLPILISDFPALRQLNEHLKFGKTVQSDDVMKIADAIDWLIDNPELRKNMGENGRKAVLKKYNAEHYSQGLLRYIENYVKI